MASLKERMKAFQKADSSSGEGKAALKSKMASSALRLGKGRKSRSKKTGVISRPGSGLARSSPSALCETPTDWRSKLKSTTTGRSSQSKFLRKLIRKQSGVSGGTSTASRKVAPPPAPPRHAPDEESQAPPPPPRRGHDSPTPPPPRPSVGRPRNTSVSSDASAPLPPPPPPANATVMPSPPARPRPSRAVRAAPQPPPPKRTTQVDSVKKNILSAARPRPPPPRDVSPPMGARAVSPPAPHSAPTPPPPPASKKTKPKKYGGASRWMAGSNSFSETVPRETVPPPPRRGKRGSLPATSAKYVRPPKRVPGSPGYKNRSLPGALSSSREAMGAKPSPPPPRMPQRVSSSEKRKKKKKKKKRFSENLRKTPDTTASLASFGDKKRLKPTPPSGPRPPMLDTKTTRELYPSKLSTKAPEVQKQTAAAMFTVKRAKKFFANLSAAHRRFASDILKVAQEERAKATAATQAPDKMNSCRDAFMWVLNDAKNMAKAHEQLAEQVQNAVNPPIERFFGIGTQVAADAAAQYKSYSQHFETVHGNVVKASKDAQRRIDNVEKMKNKDGGGFASALIEGIKGMAVGSSESRIEREHERLMESANYYKAQLSAGNMHRLRYVEQELPSVLRKLQSVEEMRISSLKHSFESYAKVMRSFGEAFIKISKDMKQVAKSISANDDIENFVANMSVVPNSVSVPDFKWGLSKTIAELKSEAASVSSEAKNTKPTNLLFGSTFERVMARQRQSKPHLKLPLILTTLVAKVDELGGFQTEGIFRLSADANEQKDLRAKIEGGDYSCKGVTSPHVTAGLLKEWLRGLKEVIVPDAMYDECVELCVHVERSGGMSAPLQDKLESILSRIPRINFQVLEQLVWVVMKASSPANVLLTKMTEKNMAIVFAPSILKNPSSDPMSMLRNAKYEIDFSQYCCDFLGGPMQADILAGKAGPACARQPGSKPRPPPPRVATTSDWEECRDADTGRVYYFNKRTNESRWEKPT